MPTPSDPNLHRALLSFPSAVLSLSVPKEGVPFYAAVTGEEAFTEVVDVVLRRAYGANVPSMSEALAAGSNHLLTEIFAPVVENENFTEQQLAWLPVSGTLILLVWVAWQSNCVTLTATPTLHTLLDHTDIANDIPASALKLPFPLCYIDLPLTTDDGVVGFFLAAKQETLLVAPVMRAESMHGAFFFEIPLNATSLVEEVNQALRLDLMGNAESPDGKPIEASNVASELSGLLSVALGRAIKILLYSTSSNARKTVVPARSRALEAMKSLGPLKSRLRRDVKHLRCSTLSSLAPKLCLPV
jgi:hypothetical protein